MAKIEVESIRVTIGERSFVLTPDELEELRAVVLGGVRWLRPWLSVCPREVGEHGSWWGSRPEDGESWCGVRPEDGETVTRSRGETRSVQRSRSVGGCRGTEG